MATIAVKVLGPQTLDMGGKAVIPVEFDSLEIYIYYRDGKPMVAAIIIRPRRIITNDFPTMRKKKKRD